MDLAAADRRAFLSGLALSMLAAALAAEAQPAGAARRIGYISNVQSSSLTESWWEAFVASLREQGWVEHQNIIIERRYTELRKEAALAVAEELVRLRVDVIVVSSTLTALAARQATTTVPIVLTVPADPVATGLVTSLARPGGNVTGLSFVGTELAGKQVELLKEAVPGLARVAVLANPTNASHPLRTKEIAEVARALKVKLDVLEARTPGEIKAAFATMAKRRPGAAIVLADPLFVGEAGNLVRLAAEQELPVMYGLREAVVAGGLMAYGASFTDLFRRAAIYVDKILKGAKPADLPVEQASKFELVINLKTAKALRLAIPQSLLVRADEVIQ
ncbi:MAG: ABC transporter substrate-binding protein [Candidatus Rokuibacteriota bacterium]|nr:MAG: ABC transporter substrate-binding protein [Candidatus Rokubacteria bacterium]